MQNHLIERQDKIKAEIEKGKASIIKANSHFIKSQATCDKTAALIEAGKISHVNSSGSLIEVFERRMEPDGTTTERYTRIQEVVNE